jgi:hypothetical protein
MAIGECDIHEILPRSVGTSASCAAVVSPSPQRRQRLAQLVSCWHHLQHFITSMPLTHNASLTVICGALSRASSSHARSPCSAKKQQSASLKLPPAAKVRTQLVH